MDHGPAGDNSLPSDRMRNKTALQGVTDQSDGKFAKNPTATAATSKNRIKTTTHTGNITSSDFSIGNHQIGDWKWVELEEESPEEKVEVAQNEVKIGSNNKSGKVKNGLLISEGFKVIDGFLIPKKKLTLKKGSKIQSRIPNITVRKPEASPSKTSIIKQSLSTIYHENSGGIQSGVAEYKPSTKAHCRTLSLS